jgi:Tol biopolymer transport system component
VKPLAPDQYREVGKMCWSFDGQSLFFVASRPRIGNQLYSLDFPVGEPQRLTNELQGYGNYGLGITADGKTLVADAWVSSNQLWSITADGDIGSAKRLTTGVNDGASGVTVLADGHIVYASHSGDDLDLWIMKGDGREAKPLTADSFYEREVSASPDGKHLVFASNRLGPSHLFRMDVDGANLKQLTHGDGSDRTPDCSPDGKWVVYASALGGKTTIWKVPLEGGTPIQLTDSHSIAPSFSPDGAFISCVLPPDSLVKKGSLAVIPANGGQPIRSFQVAPFAYYQVTPRWTPDRQAIVYTERRKSVGNLWKQPLAGGPPQQVTDFKADIIYNFAYSSDGKHIILARGPKGAYVVLMKDFK